MFLGVCSPVFTGDPCDLFPYTLLGADWRATAADWAALGHLSPPVMLTVCNRTETAARIEHYFATLENGLCYVAYELSSKYWRKGFGRSAVTAMLRELASNYQVSIVVAVLKTKNFRSHALLLNLGFDSATEEMISLVNPEADEVVMFKLLLS